MFEYEESEEIELKSVFNNDVILREIVALLNSRGGYIYIGVNNDRTICGIEKIDETLRKISDIITSQIEPTPSDLIKNSIIVRDGKNIIEIAVSKGIFSLYCIKKYGFSQIGCPVRIGTTCKELTINEINIRYQKRFESSNDYMLQIRSGYGDITFKTLQIALSNNGFHINPLSFEQNYHLRNENNEYNQLAELLSDHNNIPIIFVKFRGTDKSSISERTDYGRCSIINAYYNIKNRLISENICMTNTTVRPRIDTYLYNFDAVNEALINAFVHNDWNITEPLISMFDDRLEIISHGGLPYKQTKENFFNGISVPRNNGLMRIFQDLDITEHTGHGTLTIIKQYGESVFDIKENYINVIIPFNKVVLENHGIKSGTKNGIKSGTKNNDNNFDSLKENEIKIINLLIKDPKITLASCSQILSIPLRTVSRLFSNLQEKGYIIHEGSKRNGVWKIIK